MMIRRLAAGRLTRSGEARSISIKYPFSISLSSM